MIGSVPLNLGDVAKDGAVSSSSYRRNGTFPLIGLVLFFLGVILRFIPLGGGEFFTGIGTIRIGDYFLFEGDLSGVFCVEVLLEDPRALSLIEGRAGRNKLPLFFILNVNNTNKAEMIELLKFEYNLNSKWTNYALLSFPIQLKPRH